MPYTMGDIAASVSSGAYISLVDPNRIITEMHILDGSQTDFDSSALYFGEYDPEILKHGLRGVNLLLLAMEKISYDEIRHEGNVIIAFERNIFLEIADRGLSVINHASLLSQISNKFLNIVSEGGSLQKLLNAGCSILGNPLMLVDVSFEYIASSGTGDLSTQELWESTIQHGVMPGDYLNKIMTEKTDYLPYHDEDSLIIRTEPDSHNRYPSYSVKIMFKGTIYGYLKILQRDSEFTLFDQTVFVMLSKYISIMSDAMLQLYNFNNDKAENLFSSIITSRVNGEEAAEALIALSPIKFNNSYFVINIAFKDTPQYEDQLYFAQRKLKRIFSKKIVSIVNDGIVILYDAHNEEPVFLDKNHSFIDSLNELNCYANVSLCFSDLKECKCYYKQTRFCNEYREKTGENKPILYYRDIFEYQMITDISCKAQLSSLIHPAITKLMEIDRVNNGDLTSTLFTYIECNGSIPATSEKMFLHYNTIKHRMAKIVDKTGLNLNDGNEIFRISLSKKILEINNQDW